MSNYAESKKKLDKIRDKYGCKGEIIFRTAIQQLIDVGKSYILDPMKYDAVINEIDIRYNEAEKNNKILFTTRNFEKAIWECTKELAEIDINDLLIYIQKEIWLGDDGINYQRAIQLMKGSIAWILAEDTYETKIALQYVREMGFDDDEIETLGFGWMIEMEEEEQ